VSYSSNGVDVPLLFDSGIVAYRSLSRGCFWRLVSEIVWIQLRVETSYVTGCLQSDELEIEIVPYSPLGCDIFMLLTKLRLLRLSGDCLPVLTTRVLFSV
jgi:hypothetical protein